MSRKAHSAERGSVCGDDCRYRALYEGSQRSLLDMATRQAGAVSRIGRLRNQLILAAKRAFPRPFAEAEASLGRRFADASDEILVAYLESFLGHSVLALNSGETSGLDALRAALTARAIAVPDSADLNEWAQAVERCGPTDLSLVSPPAPAPAVAPRVSHHVVSDPFASLESLFDDTQPTPEQPILAESAGSSQPLAQAPQETPAPELASSQPDSELSGAALEDLFGPDPLADWTDPADKEPEEPEAIASNTVTPKIKAEEPGDEEPGDIFSNTIADTFDNDVFDHDTDSNGFEPAIGDNFEASFDAAFDNAFDDAEPEPDDAAANSTATTDTTPATAPAPVTQGPPVGNDAPSTLTSSVHAEVVEPESSAQIPTPAATPWTATLDQASTPDKDTSASAAETTEPVESPESPAQTPTPRWAPRPALKPQLLPKPTRANSRRSGRDRVSRSTPPDSSPDIPIDTPDTPPVELTDEVRQQLIALSALPRPVFTSDLASQIGSDDIVDAWQREWQAGDLNVRFVLPKPRDRNRGALVVPQGYLATASNEFQRSWWAPCVEMFRGAKLYQLGIFFHRFGSSTVSHVVGPEIVLVRLSTPNGLVGVIVVVGQNLAEGGATRQQLCETVETILAERVVQVAVLATNAEQVAAISDLVELESRNRNWQPTAPVTLSKSWEYAAGTGTALPLLGM